MIDFQNGTVIELSKINDGFLMETIQPLLISSENVVGAYKTMRDDYVVFTDKRIISVNVQELTGKMDFISLPYSKIQMFSVDKACVPDRDSELEMHFSGLGIVKFKFSDSSDIVKIGHSIAEFL